MFDVRIGINDRRMFDPNQTIYRLIVSLRSALLKIPEPVKKSSEPWYSGTDVGYIHCRIGYL